MNAFEKKERNKENVMQNGTVEKNNKKRAIQREGGKRLSVFSSCQEGLTLDSHDRHGHGPDQNS